MAEREPRTFYRIVGGDPPTERDFLSYKALGKPLRSAKPTRAQIAAWEAVSTYATEYEARKRLEINAELGFPLGDFIAKLVIPENATITIGPINEKTGHCDLTGEASALLVVVVLVVKA